MASIEIFISYSTEDPDKKIAKDVKEILENDFKLNAFLAHEDMEGGKKWREVLLNTLRKSKVFVSILSKQFLESPFCLQESGIAAFKKKQFILLSTDGTIPPGFLSEFQGTPFKDTKFNFSSLLDPVYQHYPNKIFQFLISKIQSLQSYESTNEIFNNSKAVEFILKKILPQNSEKFFDACVENNQVWQAYKFREFTEKAIMEDSNIKNLISILEKKYAAKYV